jgi:hypothetical protein
MRPGHDHPSGSVLKAGTPLLDLFCLRLTGFVFYISERLADDLLHRRFTGFAIETSAIPVTVAG